ncbi:MAG: secretin N-terminal domain-containing protein, partial [Candidatus Omnitrophota bacterium]
MNSKFLRIFLVLISAMGLSNSLFASFETKIILVDMQNKLIAIDKGKVDGIEEKMLFRLYRQNKFIGECLVLKASNYIAICEMRNFEAGRELKTNERLLLLTAEEQAEREKTEISSEEEMRTQAQELASEEARERELTETLKKEKAKGIAEVIKSEKELQRLKEEAEAIVKEVIEEKKKAKRIISFDFRDVDIKNIIKSIAREAEINLVIPPDFPALNLTINLKDVDMETALDTILRMVDYTFLKEDNLYRIVKVDVAEKKTISRVFSPQYIQVEKLKTLVSDGGLLSGEGKVIVDSRSNKMLVVDVPLNLSKIEDLVKQVDVKPRQVNIEAKILDVSLTDTESLGIEWTWVKPRGGASTDDTLTSGFTIDSATGLGKGFFKYGKLNAAEIALVLEALMKREKANVLSKPIITTLNN